MNLNILNDIDILAKCKPKPITPFMQCLVFFSLHLHSLNFAPKEWWFRILQAPSLRGSYGYTPRISDITKIIWGRFTGDHQAKVFYQVLKKTHLLG